MRCHGGKALNRAKKGEIASGFSGHGVQHGPATGRAVSELIRYNGYRTLDLTPFGYERVRDNIPMLESVIY